MLSGGLDSTVALKWAKIEYDKVEAVMILYGAKDEKISLKCAENISKKEKIPLNVINLDFLRKISRSSIITGKVTKIREADLKNKVISINTAKEVWIPARNLVFISIAAAYAETKGGADIITGFNREEAERFPDNSRKFLKNMNKTLRYATFEGNVKVVAPLIDCDKRQICKMAFDLKAPVELSVSCYIPIGFEGKKPIHCGSCESCMRRKRGFKEANVEDPTVYKSEEFI